MANLARRYLAGHGPAGYLDLSKWAGIRLADARAGLQEIRGETRLEASGLVDLADRPLGAGYPSPRLLGQFDPVLHGWASNDLVVHRGTTLM